MRYNKYAMPVHPDVLKRDFKSSPRVSEIPHVFNILEDVENPEEYLDADIDYKITDFLHHLWFAVDYKTGINLRDREKLSPVFQELGRIFPPLRNLREAYRGVRLPQGDYSNLLFDTYPDSMDNPLVLQILENLAFGLRSWTKDEGIALEMWAKSKGRTRDIVLFKILNPDIVIDGDAFKRGTRKDRVFDNREIVINVKNPRIIDIEYVCNGCIGDVDDYDEYDEDTESYNYYIVTIEDN